MEEIINEAAKKYADSIAQDEHKKDYCRVDFEAGAKWALENQWHDAKKEYPPFGKFILVRDDDNNFWLYRQTKNSYNILFDYWMNIPELNM